MNQQREPPRLTGEETPGPESLREALRSACDDVPDPRALQELAAILGPAFSGGASTSTAAAGSSGASGLAHAGTGATKGLALGIGKGITALVVSAACGVGGYHVWQSQRHPTLPRALDAVVAAPAAAQANAPSPPLANVEADVARLRAAPAPTETTPVGASAPSPRPSSERVGAGAALRGTGATVDPPAGRGQISTAPSAEVIAPLSEVALLELARRSLAQNPNRALQLVAEHHRRFPQGQLAEEADFIQIEALERVGRVDEAKARTDQFHVRYPSSLHGRTIDVPPRRAP